jgi:hypothetical protein
MSKRRHSMNPAEEIAKVVMEAVLPGARMEFKDNQSHGECDFDLHYPNGTVAAVEVTESADQGQKWMSAKLSKEGSGSVIEAKHCKKSWIIFAMDAKTIPAIRRKTDEYLAKVEQAGKHSFTWLDACTTRLQREVGLEGVIPSRVPRCVEDICYDLKIKSASVIWDEGPAKIFIAQTARGGAVGPSVALKAGEHECQKHDNRKKLGAAKTAERHLLVYVGESNGLARAALSDFEPPQELPNLPEGITHIWLAGWSISEVELVVWRASTKETWRRQPAWVSPDVLNGLIGTCPRRAG